MVDGFSLPELAYAVGIVGGFAGIYFQLNAQRRAADDRADKRAKEIREDADTRQTELKDTIDKHNLDFEGRLRTLETKISDFMPRKEIENAIAHEKGNRVQSDASLKIITDRHDAAISEIRISLGKMDTQNAGIVSDIGELKALLKENAIDTRARLERLTEAVVQAPPHPRAVA